MVFVVLKKKMNHILRMISCLFFCACLLSMKQADDKVVKDFTLQNVDGKMVSTKDFKDAKGMIIIFGCVHCPFAKLYHERLNQLQVKYSKSHIQLLLVNSSDTLMFADESLKNMTAVAREKKYIFPYLFDPSQQVAKDFKAEKTPHAFVIWKGNNKWIIKYNGAIDDNGAHPDLVKTKYVSNALDELLAGKKVSITEGQSIGCAIHYRR